MRVFKIFLLMMGGLLFSLSAFAVPPSANLPLDSWVYPALDKLSGLGLIDSSLQGSRPYTRMEAARQVVEASQNAALRDVPPVVDQLLRRLKNQLHEALGEVKDEGASPSSYIQPIRDFTLKYVYKDGAASSFPGTNARQFALNGNNFGIQYANHHNGQMSFQGDALLGGIFLLSWRPLFQIGQGDGENGGATLRLLQGKAALQLGPVEFSFGRQSLWWGQGRHGSLILTDNAQPLDMVRVTNPTPILLPGVLRYLGPFRFDLFWSRLDEDRAVAHPYLSGLRFTFKPVPWFELGASHTILFGGKGRPDPTFIDSLIGNHFESVSKDDGDPIAGLDFRLRLPFLAGATLYGEWYGENEMHHLPSRTSQLFGLYLPVVEPTQRASLRLEYANLNYAGWGAEWYRSDVYQSGYTYEEDILGHQVGGDARDFYAELRVILPADVTASLNFTFQERGYHQPVQEKHLQPGVELEWQFQKHLALKVDYRMDRVSNFDFVDGANRTFQLADIALEGSW